MTTDVEPYKDALAYLGLDPRRPEVQALVLLGRRYGLDLLLGEIQLIATKTGPKTYISRNGLLTVAHRSGQLDGLVVDEQRRNSTDDGWTAYVSVWRKDMSHPFRYGAQCKDNEPQAQAGNGPEMALARAERRALLRAFNIPVDDEVESDATPPVPDPPHHVVEGADPKDKLVCSCGRVFATAAGFAHHREQPEIGPGPASKQPPPAAAVDAAPPAAPAGPGPKQTKQPKRRDESPPPSYYDSLPESTGGYGAPKYDPRDAQP